MKHTIRILTVAALALALVSVGAFAGVRPDRNNFDNSIPTQYSKLQYAPETVDNDFVEVPFEPDEPEASPMAGPVDMSKGNDRKGAATLVRPTRAGSMMSPEQQASRQIRRLIRALN